MRTSWSTLSGDSLTDTLNHAAALRSSFGEINVHCLEHPKGSKTKKVHALCLTVFFKKLHDSYANLFKELSRHLSSHPKTDQGSPAEARPAGRMASSNLPLRLGQESGLDRDHPYQTRSKTKSDGDPMTFRIALQNPRVADYIESMASDRRRHLVCKVFSNSPPAKDAPNGTHWISAVKIKRPNTLLVQFQPATEHPEFEKAKTYLEKFESVVAAELPMYEVVMENVDCSAVNLESGDIDPFTAKAIAKLLARENVPPKSARFPVEVIRSVRLLKSSKCS